MDQMRFEVPIDLCQVFDSGQTFLWERDKDAFCASHLRGPVRVWETEDGFSVSPCEKNEVSFWENYFDLGSDYAAQLAPVMDAPLAAAMAACPGLRLLRQPFFETLCAFISSAHNAMPRIRAIMRGLHRLGEDGRFPGPEQVAAAGVKGLEQLGMGYRAPYLYKSACMVLEGLDESAFEGVPYEEALKEIQRFSGVGEKVADCILLFSLGYRQAFPVDVWMLRAMEELYGIKGKPHAVKMQAMERFGEYAGVAQMYLFHAFRTGALKTATLDRVDINPVQYM